MIGINATSLYLTVSRYFPGIDAYICVTTTPTSGWKFYVRSVVGWIRLLIYSLTPLIVMFIANTAIIIILVVAARRRQQNTSGGTSQNLSNMTVTLLLVCFIYTCLSLPVCVLSLSKLPGGMLYTAMLFYLETCKYANHAFNFFLYCCSGARFRQELTALFRCKKRSDPPPSQLTASSSNTLSNA